MSPIKSIQFFHPFRLIGFICVVNIFFQCKEGKTIFTKSEPVIFDQIDVKDSNQKIVMKYDSLGNKLIQGTVINGKKNGSWATFNTLGVIQTVYNYVDDKKNGIYFKIGLDNKLEEQATYKDDLLDGLFTRYLFGRLDEQMEFKQGKKNGWSKKYYMGGGVEKAMEMKDDVQDGIYRFYHEDGSIMVEEKYKAGKKISGGIVK